MPPPVAIEPPMPPPVAIEPPMPPVLAMPPVLVIPPVPREPPLPPALALDVVVGGTLSPQPRRPAAPSKSAHNKFQLSFARDIR